ncbi:COMM domain-containing protein 3-like [Phymastichus coffea]|uniref:COMM domain-containing protein 3-like n=1 Tax=Phymastichus coffea TaxID=108790 RepID=UPI00273CDB1E|nr:COMM domain-containing protein 3-like [Phymastichus coffea]
MELTETQIKCLINEENFNNLSEDSFEKILQIALSHVCGRFNTQDLSQIDSSKPDIVKTAYADITKLLMESARNNATVEELRTLLNYTDLNKILINSFCDAYENHQKEIQENLETVGNSLSHIVDVEWQLDYCIKSNVHNPAGIINYHLSLSTMKNGTIEHIKFTCTQQQLQELVYKLKDATRHVEKLTSS